MKKDKALPVMGKWVNLLRLPKVIPTFQLCSITPEYFQLDNLCSTQELHRECPWVSISSLRTERERSANRRCREQPMVPPGSVKTPPHCTVSLRLWTPRREAVSEGCDGDREGDNQCRAEKLPREQEDEAPPCYCLEATLLPRPAPRTPG